MKGRKPTIAGTSKKIALLTEQVSKAEKRLDAKRAELARLETLYAELATPEALEAERKRHETSIARLQELQTNELEES